MKNIAVIFAGGIGRRMNQTALPKQFLKLHGKEIIIHTLEHFQNHAQIDGIVIACVEDWVGFMKELLVKYNINKVGDVVVCGITGQESIYYGLKRASELYGTETNVLVHDGVRPLINEKTITNCIESIEKNGTGITTAPVTETIIRVNDKAEIVDVIDRTDCLLARAPLGFRLRELLETHEKARKIG